MKNLVSVLFVILTLHVSAQDVHFTDIGNRWQTQGVPTAAAVSSWWAYGATDTTIGGNSYRRLEANYLDNVGGGLLPFSLNYYVREDTDSGFVFIYDTSWGGDDTLYNYKRKVHDTFAIGSYIWTITDTDISMITAGPPQTHKLFSMKLVESTDTNTYYVVQGIGSTINPVFPFYWDRPEILHCFTDSAFYPTVLFPGKFQLQCITGITPVTNNTALTIYPNPAHDELTIDAGSAPVEQVAITNLMGQCVQSAVYTSQSQVTVDVSGLPSGIYFVKINNTAVRKFVKE